MQLRESPIPVSYTHLDVYKRQVVIPIAYAAEATARLTGREPFTTLDGIRMAAVSYTHLDVYKRQIRACRKPPRTLSITSLQHGSLG